MKESQKARGVAGRWLGASGSVRFVATCCVEAGVHPRLASPLRARLQARACLSSGRISRGADPQGTVFRGELVWNAVTHPTPQPREKNLLEKQSLTAGIQWGLSGREASRSLTR